MNSPRKFLVMGAVSGFVTGLAPGLHTFNLEAIAPNGGLSIGVIGSGQPNANLTLEVVGV